MRCREIALRPTRLARVVAPRQLLPRFAWLAGEFTDALQDSSRPALAIGCGRIAALATRHVRGFGIPTVQILDPRIDPSHWDVVIAPRHDKLQGENVIELLGSLNPVDTGWLDRARQDFPALGSLATPRTMVLVGGPTPACRLGMDQIHETMQVLDAWLARDGGSLTICGSRRTPADWVSLFRGRYASHGNVVWMDADDGRNPYAAALGWAERIVVTADSTNMISEACATPLPVYLAGMDKATGRAAEFISFLQLINRVLPLATEARSMSATALQETSRVAELVAKRLRLR